MPIDCVTMYVILAPLSRDPRCTCCLWVVFSIIFLHLVNLGIWFFYPHSILGYLLLLSSPVHHSLDVFRACVLCSHAYLGCTGYLYMLCCALRTQLLGFLLWLNAVFFLVFCVPCSLYGDAALSLAMSDYVLGGFEYVLVGCPCLCWVVSGLFAGVVVLLCPWHCCCAAWSLCCSLMPLCLVKCAVVIQLCG